MKFFRRKNGVGDAEYPKQPRKEHPWDSQDVSKNVSAETQIQKDRKYKEQSIQKL